MKNHISCVAFDLDGTLLRSDGTVSESTRATISLLQEQGCLCTIATGRMFRSAEAIAQDLSISGVPLIAYNGSLLKVPGEPSPLFSRGIPKTLAGEVLRFCKDQGWYVQSYTEDRLLVEKKSFWTEYYEKTRLGKSGIPGRGLLFPLPGSSQDSSRRRKRGRALSHDPLPYGTLRRGPFPGGFQNSGSPFSGSGGPGSPQGKGPGKALRTPENFPRGNSGFGDSENDVPLFESAAFSVAMGNAAPSVRSRADFVTESNDEEGIPRFFESHRERFSFGTSRMSRSA